MSNGVLKPLGESNAFWSRVSSSRVGRSSGSVVGKKGANEWLSLGRYESRRSDVRSAATSSATVRSATPEAPCTFGPPRSSGDTSSPSTDFTTPGPVSPKNESAGWMTNEPCRGR